MSVPVSKMQEARAEPDRAPTSTRYAWYVVLALTAIYMLSYMDRQILSLLVGPMKRDLGISDTRVGPAAGAGVRAVLHVHGVTTGADRGYAQPAGADCGRSGALEHLHLGVQRGAELLVAILGADGAWG